ncbi:hypothetical protein [Inquilinus limosus]|uniref:hypothetical protein n=1 Tax=Inquilinus limosus TaxID=171674 RepID=UPI000422A3EA|nr:hypothetical protein [Inquilinus limosus]
MTQFFYIRSLQSPNYVLNGQGGNPVAGQAIITWTQVEGLIGGYNELWILQNQQMEVGPNTKTSSFQMPQYYIASASSPDLVFDLGPDINGSPSVVLATKVAGKASQIWSLQPGTISDEATAGVLVNTSNGQALTASGTYQGAQLVTSALPNPVTSGYAWQIEPCAVPVNQPTTIQCMQFGLQSPQVITISQVGTFDAPNGSLSVAPIVPPTKGKPTWPANAIWVYTLDGLIVSSDNPQLALTWCSNGIYALPRQPAGYNSLQQWIVTAAPAEWSDGNDTYKYSRLTISPYSQPDRYLMLNQWGGLAIQAYDGGAAANGSMYWANGSGYPLESIMAQPPLPFPTGPSDNDQYAQSYSYISANVNPQAKATAGIRAYYTTSNQQELGIWRSQVSTMQMPSSITDPAAWAAVVKQLDLELSIAAAIQGNYAVMSNLADQMEGTIKSSVNDLSALIGHSLGTATGSLATLGEGLVLAGVNLIPDLGGAIATLMQTGLNLATGNGGIKVTKFEMAVADLQTSVNNTFAALQAAIAQQQTAILSDWGKMQALNQLVTLPTWHPNTLYLSDDATIASAEAVGYGAQLAILQYLMPAGFQIWRWYNMSGSVSQSLPPNAPGYAQYRENLPGGVFNLYMVAGGSYGDDGGHNSSYYPSQAVMNRIWELGTQPANFFNRCNGWDNFTVQSRDVGGQWIADGEDNPMRGGWCNLLLGTIQNCTPNQLSVRVSTNHDCALSWNTDTVTVGPWGLVTYALRVGNHDDTSANIYVYDPTYSSSNEVLEFEMVGGQGSCYMNGPYTTQDNYNLTPQSKNGHTYDANSGPPDELTVWVVQG